MGPGDGASAVWAPDGNHGREPGAIVEGPGGAAPLGRRGGQGGADGGWLHPGGDHFANGAQGHRYVVRAGRWQGGSGFHFGLRGQREHRDLHFAGASRAFGSRSGERDP